MQDKKENKCCNNCDHYEKLGGYTGNCELNHGITCQGLGKICFTNDGCEDYKLGNPKPYCF